MYKDYHQAYCLQYRSWHLQYKKIMKVVFQEQSTNIWPESAKQTEDQIL